MKKAMFVLLLISVAVVYASDPNQCTYTYPDGRRCPGTSYAGTFGQYTCSNPDCPGLISSHRDTSEEDAYVGAGNLIMQVKANKKWNNTFGDENLHPYIDAVRRANPILQDKRIIISLGPSNELEFFVDNDCITHLVWHIIESIRGESIKRVPVIAGYYEARGTSSGSMEIQQQGRTAKINTYLPDGSRLYFEGVYRDWQMQDGRIVYGFFGPVKTIAPDGSDRSMNQSMFIQPIMGNNPGIQIENWVTGQDGRLVHNQFINPSIKDSQGKAHSPRM